MPGGLLHPAPWPAVLFSSRHGLPAPASRRSALLSHIHDYARTARERHTGAGHTRPGFRHPECLFARVPVQGRNRVLTAGSPVRILDVPSSEPARARATRVRPLLRVTGNTVHRQIELLPFLLCRQGIPDRTRELCAAAADVARHRAVPAGARGGSLGVCSPHPKWCSVQVLLPERESRWPGGYILQRKLRWSGKVAARRGLRADSSRRSSSAASAD